MLEKIYSTLYCSWVKSWYEQISSSETEDIFLTKKKLVIILKDQTLGKEIYDIISALSNSNKTFTFENMSFKIVDYAVVEGAISYFSVSLPEEFNWQDYKKMDKIQKIVLFISGMCNQGVFVDESKFEFEDFDSISKILSFLTIDSDKGTYESTIVLLIKYSHYYLSGKNDFEEFYSKIDKEVFFEVSDMPYNFSIVQMCYKYYLTGELPDDIYNKICSKGEVRYSGYLAVKNNGWENCDADEITDEYAIYGDVKIFNKMPEDFKRFLIYDYDSEDIRCLCKENGEERVINLDGQIVGYKTTSDLDESSILDIEINSQKSLIEFFKKILVFVSDSLKVRNYGTNNEVELEKSVVYDFSSFKFKTFSQLYQFFGTNHTSVFIQVAQIFCKMYKKLVINLYGEVNSQEELLSKAEVRYFSPVLIREFTNFYFGKEVKWNEIYNEIQKFLFAKYYFDNDHDLYYDSRFEYNPFEIPFCFDYEIEEKYDKKLKVGMQKSLADGRMLIIFSSEKSIRKFAKNCRKTLKEVKNKIGDIESEHIKFTGISEIIYSREISIDKTYKFIGYITTPVDGEVLTKRSFLSLDNKQLMLVFGYYFAKFSTYTFYNKDVRVDKNLVFYINVLAEDFGLKETKCSSTRWYLNRVIKSMVNLGYNPNAFIGCDIDHLQFPDYSSSFIKLANSYDSYCDEHKIYYNGKVCPACLLLNCYLSDEQMENAILVFEDDIAQHYKISSEYNLKLYKPDVVDMTDMENRVDRIVRARVDKSYDSIDLVQDCFVPVKKAYNDDKQFVGYIYDTVNFDGSPNNLCIDLTDLERIKNLPRLKALIRLLNQVQILLEEGKTFSQNPFSHVFLNKEHKKQVQILNIEFADGRGNKSDLINWTCEYALMVIGLDETLKLVEENDDKIVQFIKKIQAISNFNSNNFSTLLKKLEKTAARMTKYCTLHRLYYDQDYVFCPKCIGVEDTRKLKVEYVSKDYFADCKQVGDGGEAIVYEYDSGYVAKIFRENANINYGLKTMVLARIMQRSETLTSTNKYEYVIPEKILIDDENHQMIGYVMKKVTGLPLSVLKDKQVVGEQYLTKRDVFEILINVGEGIEKLHSKNIFIGDLNGKNILFDVTKRVYFLDFDGMGVDDVSPEFCTDGYIDPISKKKQLITQKDDWYSFAVQVFYYLTYTHPFNGIYMENGKALDIPTKMERRLSLLGRHGMKVPAVAEKWDWMSAELKNTFFNIFENELRVSIVPYLVEQYNYMYEGEAEQVKINPKFVAVINTQFEDENVIYVINFNAAVCEKEGEKYAIVLTDNHRYVIKNIPCFDGNSNLIKDVIITENEKFAFVIACGKLFVVDLEKDVCIETVTLRDDNNFVVNGNSIFCKDFHKEKVVITKRTVSSGGEIEKEQYRIGEGTENLKKFGVAFSSKFVMVLESDYYNDLIYCNDYKLCQIGCDNKETQYNVLYDRNTKTWLVINDEKNAVIIGRDGYYNNFRLEDDITVCAPSVIYVNGNIFIPGNECLWIVSAKKQFKCKKMECRKIMDSSSKICINQNGFSVITNGILYDVFRG